MSETIAPNKVVAINYAVKTEDGQTLDQSKDGSPLNFIHGRGMLIPGLENALEGKTVGDSFTAEVKPEEAYGERHDGLIRLYRATCSATTKFSLACSSAPAQIKASSLSLSLK